ncbi:MAG TPA: DNA-directed RNA polymerase subunit N [Thermoplasmata archaeon]|nr:DNA-directed RNA polymerase subunit N [Thermoplasmata archaeon]
MIIPVRCFTCGKVVASSLETFVNRTRAGEPPSAVLDDVGLTRYCCRRMILANVELIDEVLPFR